MICGKCGGYVEWKGPLTNLTHTECASCGAVNAQIPDEEIEAGEPLEATAAKASFEEDHALASRSWGRGRHGSIPKTHGADGRNWVD